MNKLILLLIIICQLSIVNSSAQTWMNIYLSDGSMTQIDISTIDSITYTVSSPGVLATITTTGVTGISGPSALSGGNITADGGSTISHRGVCWATTTSPTTANDTTLDGTGTGTGSYTSTLTGLSANTTYYVRAYAINSAGTAYGNEVSFTTGDIYTMGSGVTDIDGNTYTSIILGTQEWMQQNLRVTRYANGDSIHNGVYNSWGNIDTVAQWASYINSSSYDIPYGKYYNWYAATDVRNACPTGWHLPSLTEWSALRIYLNPNINQNYDVLSGEMLTEVGSAHWQAGANPGATNSSGFTAVGSGLDFAAFGTGAEWWSSTPGPNSISAKTMSVGPGLILSVPVIISLLESSGKTKGNAVRCLKN